ncbi:MAG: hypothetical protein WC875_03390 [Candidatus Absconditabacterales bacterium]|jgi:hypothetical protein
MHIQDLLAEGKTIWGNEKLPLAQIIVRMGKVFGDICRYERNASKDMAVHTDEELKKELGNIIFSTIRRCDDLGYDPQECIQLAMDCQKKFLKKWFYIFLIYFHAYQTTRCS